MLEYITLGAIQGVTEWLPVSSEGIIVLVSTYFFPALSLGEAVRLALFLHLGTFLAALIYLRNDVRTLIVACIWYSTATKDTRSELHFLMRTSFVTAIIALPLLILINNSSSWLTVSITGIGTLIGTLLIVTGLLHRHTQQQHIERTRASDELTVRDACMTGIFQGFAVLPGLSRSGLTVAALLIRTIRDSDSLRLSFLLSLPVVLGGNILLNAYAFTTFGANEAAALATAFIFGLLTMHGLMRVARHLSWSTFTILAGVLLIIGALV